jgi:hypothetical protein
MKVNMALLRLVCRLALSSMATLALLAAGSGMAAAQEVEPNEFVAAPAGTNILLGYYFYQHNTDFNVAGGSTIKNSGLQVNVGLARYVHFTTLFGQPAGVQIYEAFGSESGGHIDDVEHFPNAFGASSPALSAFFYPYADPVKKQYLVVTGFFYPPIGTYDKNSPVNLTSALSNSIGWAGDAQIGWDQGIGDHFSYDLSFDVRAFGDTTGPFAPGIVSSSTVFSKNPDFRLQAWANWRFNPMLQASIGWESLLGGTQYENGLLTGGQTVPSGNKSEFERLRLAGSAFLSPRSQVLLEVNHDFVAVGGFKEQFGLVTRFVYIF